jgi:hypothetical protein
MSTVKPVLLVVLDNHPAEQWVRQVMPVAFDHAVLDLSGDAVSYAHYAQQLQPYLATHHLVFAQTLATIALVYYCFGQFATQAPQIFQAMPGTVESLSALNVLAPPAFLALPAHSAFTPWPGKPHNNWGIVLGQGVGKQAIAPFKKLAHYLGAPLYGTQRLIERGLLPKASLVGISGQKIQHDYLLCCGLSGAVSFLMGLAEGVTIIAINHQENAPIFRHAHLCWQVDIGVALGHINAWVKMQQDAKFCVSLSI